MSKAPERIWVSDIPWDLEKAGDLCALGFAWNIPHGSSPTEFVNTSRIEELEAKLEMAVELVGRAFNEGFIEGMNDVLRKGGGKSWHESRSRTTLAELKGDKE